MQNTDIHVTSSRVLIQECPGGSLQGWRALINGSLWTQLREDGLAIPEIIGTGRQILKMSYKGCSDEIHIGYSGSNVSMQVSYPSGMNLKQHLSQLVLVPLASVCHVVRLGLHSGLHSVWFKMDDLF
jgi:hypothetical protein